MSHFLRYAVYIFRDNRKTSKQLLYFGLMLSSCCVLQKASQKSYHEWQILYWEISSQTLLRHFCNFAPKWLRRYHFYNFPSYSFCCLSTVIFFIFHWISWRNFAFKPLYLKTVFFWFGKQDWITSHVWLSLLFLTCTSVHSRNFT